MEVTMNRRLTTVVSTMLLVTFALVHADDRKANALLQQAQAKEQIEGNLKDAVKLDEEAVKEAGSNRSLAARALLGLGHAYELLGDAQARAVYTQVVRDYADQSESAANASGRLSGLKPTGPSRPNEMRISKLLEGTLSLVVPSPDGKLLAFEKGEALYVYEVASGQSRQIVSAPRNRSESIASAAFAHDGRRLLYAVLNFETHAALRMVTLDGQDRELLDMKDSGNVAVIGWSPDDRQVAIRYLTREAGEPRVIAMFDVASGRLREVYRAPTNAAGSPISEAALSPDGRWFAFSDHFDISVVATAAGNNAPTIAVEHPARDRVVGWTADGRLAFTSDRSGPTDLYVQTMQNGRAAGAPQRIKSDVGSSAYLGLTPTGAAFYSVSMTPGDVFLAELDSAGRLSSSSPIAGRFAGYNSVPDYSHDGRFLAYNSGPQDSPQGAIRIRTLATGEERPVARPFQDIRQLRWSSDDRAILVLGDVQSLNTGAAARNSRLERVDVTTGARTTLLADLPGMAATNPTLGPDGSLYYEQFINDAATLMRLRPGAAQPEQVYRPATGTLRIYTLSPDGTEIVFNLRRDAKDFLYRMKLNSGEPVPFYSYPPNEWARGWGGLNWSADGKSVYYHHGINGGDELVRIPIATGTPEKLVTTGIIRRIAVHPDGRHLAWEARTSMNELWMIENLVPAK